MRIRLGEWMDVEAKVETEGCALWSIIVIAGLLVAVVAITIVLVTGKVPGK